MKPRKMLAMSLPIFLIFFFVQACGQFTDLDEPKGSLRGKVTLAGMDDYSGVNASLSNTSLDAVTNGDGDFIIDNIPAGTYNLVISKTDYQTEVVRSISVEIGEDIDLTEIQLDLLLSSVTGIFLLADKEVHSGILIQIRRTGLTIVTAARLPAVTASGVTQYNYSTVTNDSGEFGFYDIPVGTYSLKASKEYFKDRELLITVTEGPLSLEAEPLQGDPGKITGIITLEGKYPGNYGGVDLVDNYGNDSVTLPDGAFTINVPEPMGIHIVNASYPGYEPYVYPPVPVSPGETVRLPDELLLMQKGSIAGIALLEGEVDHNGIRITLSEPGFSATTNPAGDFTISGIPAGVGLYSLTASKANYNPVQKSDITVVANQQNYVGTLQLSPKYGSISGFITKELGDDPEGTILSLEGTALTTSTSSTGAYLLTPVPPGIYNLIAVPREERYLTGRIEGIPVEPGMPTTDVNLVLQTAPLPPVVEYSTPMSSSSIAVTWNPNPMETQDIKGYNVYYRTSTDLYYIMANPAFGDVTSTTYEVTGLTRGTQYYFKVTAVDYTDLESAYSQEDNYQFIYPLEAFPVPEIALPNSIPGTPRDIALYADGITTKIYVTSGTDDKVYVIDPVTDTVNTTITADSFQLLTRGIAANPAQGEVYVADTTNDRISVIEVATDTVTSSFYVGGNYNPVGIFVYSSDDGIDENDFIFIADQGTSGGLGDIRIFDAHTKALLHTLDNTPFGIYPSWMVIANGKLYVSNGNGTNVTGSVSVVEFPPGTIASATTGSITSATITSSIKVGLQDRTFPTPMAVSADEGNIYVVNNNTDPIGTVSVIDTNVDKVITTLDVGIRPRGITSVGDIVYVVSYSEVNISVIDTRLNQV
ncbi:MAG: carboxypeptidase regulatory-like domain-containing protein, partial [Deltaproteobacteria bacterium]